MLKEKIIDLIAENLGVEKEKINLAVDFYSDLNVSKLEVADLIVVCQKQLKISLPPVNVEKLTTVDQLIRLFEENSNEL